MSQEINPPNHIQATPPASPYAGYASAAKQALPYIAGGLALTVGAVAASTFSGSASVAQPVGSGVCFPKQPFFPQLGNGPMAPLPPVTFSLSGKPSIFSTFPQEIVKKANVMVEAIQEDVAPTAAVHPCNREDASTKQLFLCALAGMFG